MATRVLSIEIGKGVTNVVEMDYKAAKTKIYNCFSFETPQGVIRDGVVARNELFSSLFKTECAKYGIKTKKAVFVVSSSRLASRDVKVPLVKEKRLTEVVNASATDFFPVDMNQYHLVYKVLGKENTPEDKNYKLNVLAVPNDLTTCYYDMAKSLDLELVALDYVGNSIMQTVGKSFVTDTNAIVKVEEENTFVTIVKDGKVVLQRTLSYGVSDTINAVRDCGEFGNNLSYLDAVKVLSGKAVIRRFMNAEDTYKEEEDTDDRMKAARIEVTETLRYLIGNIGRVLEYYSSRNNNDQIASIALTGLGADFSGLSKLMSNELGQKAKVFQDFANASFTHADENASMNLNSYAACIGAGMAPLNLIPEKSALSKSKAEKRSSNGVGMLVAGIIIGVAGLAAAFALWFISYTAIQKVKLEQTKVQADIDRMKAEGVEDVYNEYNAAVTLNEQINMINDSTKSRSEDLVAFIEELEMKLPSDLLVLNFTATPTGVTMSIECGSKEIAAKTLMQLRTFESVDIVSSTGLNDATVIGEEVEESEEHPVTFTVDCVYKPFVEAEIEATEGGAN